MTYLVVLHSRSCVLSVSIRSAFYWIVKLILSGHIHRRQLLVKSSEKRENSQTVVFSGSTERTSFAEKDDPKGFFEFIFSKNQKNQTYINGYKFIELPSRPMVDLTLTTCASRQKLKKQIMSSICQIDRDAIVHQNSGYR